MTARPPTVLDMLNAAADGAAAAETAFRREVHDRIAALDRERTFAFRRLNLMRAVADAIGDAESEDVAVASALAILRVKLDWSGDSEARSAVLTRFGPVAQAMFVHLAPDLKLRAHSDAKPVPTLAECAQSAEIPAADVMAALAAFEAWYAESRGTPFWVLFDRYIPETPVVDF